MVFGLEQMVYEYTHKMGYQSIITDYNECDRKERRLLVKVEEQDGVEKKKAILVIDAGIFKIRDSRDFAYWREWTCRQFERVEDNNLLLVVIGRKNGSLHYKGKNVIFYDCVKNKVHGCLISKEMKNEYKAICDGRKEARIKCEELYSKYPENFRHGWFIVYILIAINLVLSLNTNIEQYGFSPKTLLMDGQTYRAFTYMFLHANVLHAVGNMMALYVAGKMVARIEGFINFLVIYLCGGVFASLGSAWYGLNFSGEIDTFTVGSSGAIFAIIGALLVEAFMDRDVEKVRGKVMWYVFVSVALSSIGSNVDVMCHFFGLFAGVVLTIIIKLLDEITFQDRNKKLQKQLDKIDKRREERGYEKPEPYYKGEINR